MRNILGTRGLALLGAFILLGAGCAPAPAPDAPTAPEGAENGEERVMRDEGAGAAVQETSEAAGNIEVAERAPEDVPAMVKEEPPAVVETGMEKMEKEESGPDVTVQLSGANFAFSQDEIRVKQGDTVRVVFTSTSGFHDWTIDEFGAATRTVSTGETSEVTFVADKAGSFEFYCSVGSHRALGMVGTLIVE